MVMSVKDNALWESECIKMQSWHKIMKFPIKDFFSNFFRNYGFGHFF